MQPKMAQPALLSGNRDYKLGIRRGSGEGVQQHVPAQLCRAAPPWLWGLWGAAVTHARSQGWSFPTIPTVLVGLSQ